MRITKMATAVALAVTSTAALSACQGSFGSRAVHGIPGHGYEATGQIHPHNFDTWCLTAPQNFGNLSNVFIEPCLEKDPRQTWHIAMTTGVGQIQMVTAAYSVGQSGNLTTARLIKNDGTAPVNDWHIVNFTEVQGEWWTIELPKFRGGSYLTTRVGLLKPGVYPVSWEKSLPPARAVQNWDLPQLTEVN